MHYDDSIISGEILCSVFRQGKNCGYILIIGYVDKIGIENVMYLIKNPKFYFEENWTYYLQLKKLWEISATFSCYIQL